MGKMKCNIECYTDEKFIKQYEPLDLWQDLIICFDQGEGTHE